MVFWKNWEDIRHNKNQKNNGNEVRKVLKIDSKLNGLFRKTDSYNLKSVSFSVAAF